MTQFLVFTSDNLQIQGQQLTGLIYWPYAAYKHPGTLHVILGTYIAHKIGHLLVHAHVRLQYEA